MSVILNFIEVDFNSNPPVVKFLQGNDMSVENIRDTLRAIEESEDGRMQEHKKIIKVGGHEDFDPENPGANQGSLTVTVLSPYQMEFEPGPLAFKSSEGNLLGTYIESPGAIVQINNAVGAVQLNSDLIEYSAFRNAIWVDTVNGYSLSDPDAGKPFRPIDNIYDAETLAIYYGFSDLKFLADYTFKSTDELSGLDIYGKGLNRTTFTFTSGCNLNNCRFYNSKLTGAIFGIAAVYNCDIYNLECSNLFPANHTVLIKDSFLSGILKMCANFTGNMFFETLKDGSIDDNIPVLDINGATFSILARDVYGDFQIINSTDSGFTGIFNFSSGRLGLDSSITAGNFDIRGDVEIDTDYTSVTDLKITKTLSKEEYDQLMSIDLAPLY